MFGNNLKVFFAGSEQLHIALCANKAGVKYYLFTVFHYIAQRFGIKPFNSIGGFAPPVLEKIARHVIMDSGLFTLMFGAQAGRRDKAFLEQWQEELVNFVKSNNLSCTCVEVDCQKILGVEEAWKFRKKLKTSLPKNRIINVFHHEDGQKGLDRLIEFSDYIAISVPELRIMRGTSHQEDTYRLACHIKNKKPDIDIHLLGCTAWDILKRCKFCTSSDSTSWQTPNRYGHILGYKTKLLKQEKKIEYDLKARELCRRNGLEENAKRIEWMRNYILSAKLFLDRATRVVGSQD